MQIPDIIYKGREEVDEYEIKQSNSNFSREQSNPRFQNISKSPTINKSSHGSANVQRNASSK